MAAYESLSQLIADVFDEIPSGDAIVLDDLTSKEVLSYSELCQRIETISSEILEFVSEGDHIGVHAKNSIDIICILFSVLKIRAVFCPLGLDGCAEKTRDLFQAVGIQHLIVSKEHLESSNYLKGLMSNGTLKTHPLSCLKSFVVLRFTARTPPQDSKNRKIEFVVTSSGSTGPHKVIKVPGKCIIPNIRDLQFIFNVTSSDVVFMSSPLTFDASIVQIFVALLAKAKLVVVPGDVIQQPGKLCKILFERNQTTILQATPSLVHLIGEVLLRNGTDFTDTSLRILCLGAEPFPQKATLRAYLKTPSDLQLYNLYGLSEVSSWASIERVDFSRFSNTMSDGATYLENRCSKGEMSCQETLAGDVSIGDPLSDTVIQVRNEGGDILDEGCGEIWVGGKGRVCFVDEETDMVEDKMRPSGDIGMIKNGKISFVCRKDHRVKIFGKFVNLEAIEAVAGDVNGVTSSVCVHARPEERLIGCLVLFLAINGVASRKTIENSVVQRLSAELPTNHSLVRFVFLKEMPLNQHGKKDRLILQKTAMKRSTEHTFNKYSDFDDVLIDLFRAAARLPFSSVLLYDEQKTFIENGGNSVAAVYLEKQIFDYMDFLTSGTVNLTSLYDKLLSQSFTAVSSDLKGELAKRRMPFCEAKPGLDCSSQAASGSCDLSNGKRSASLIPSNSEAVLDGERKRNLSQNRESGIGSKRRLKSCLSNDCSVEADSSMLMFGNEPTRSNTGMSFAYQDRASIDNSSSINCCCRAVANVSTVVTSAGRLPDSYEDDWTNGEGQPPGTTQSCTKGADLLLRTRKNAGAVLNALEGGEDTPAWGKFETSRCSQSDASVGSRPTDFAGASWPSSNSDNPSTVSRPQNEGKQPSENYPKEASPEYDVGPKGGGICRPHALIPRDANEDGAKSPSAGKTEISKCVKRRKIPFNTHIDALRCNESEAHDCYCSLSRGGRCTVCEFCLAHGSTEVCLGLRDFGKFDASTRIKMRWRCDTAKCVDASPLVVCGGAHASAIVYIGSHSHFFYAINSDDGNIIWQSKLGDRIESSAAISKDGSKIYVGCYDYFVYVISRTNGAIIWKTKAGESVKCSPVVSKVNGFVFFGSHDHHMYGIDTENQLQIWRSHCGGGSIFSSPALSDDCCVLYVGTLGGNFVALDAANGKTLWTFNARKPIFASPACVDRCVCFCGVDGCVYVVTRSGNLVWRYKTQGPIFSSPCISLMPDSYCILIGSHDSAVQCLSSDGDLIWKILLDAPVYSTPVDALIPSQAEKRVEGIRTAAEDVVIACSTKGTLYTLSRSSGSVIKASSFDKDIFSSPVVVKNTVIIGCRDNNVYSMQL